MVACLPPTNAAVLDPYIHTVRSTVAAVAAAGDTEVPEFKRVRSPQGSLPGLKWNRVARWSKNFQKNEKITSGLFATIRRTYVVRNAH